MKDFYATESAFLSVCFTYNLLSLYQHASAPEQRHKTGFKRPATLWAAVFIGGAVLGNRSRTPVLYIAEVAARATRRRDDKREISGKNVRRVAEK